jgi:hypothetical protein
MSEGAPKSVVKTGEEPTKTIEINGIILEVGPNLGELSWDDMNESVEKLNKTLNEGEKPWRILTKEEYDELMKPIAAMENMSDEQFREVVKKYLSSIGFDDDNIAYWSSTEYTDEDAWIFYGIYGYTEKSPKTEKLAVQCFR